MIKILIGDEEYDFPTNWGELPIGKWRDAMSILDENDDTIGRNVMLVSKIAGIPKDTLLDIPHTEYSKVKELANSLANIELGKPEFEIEIEGKKYRMVSEISKMSTGEFIDLDTIASDEQNSVANLHVLMAILFRPVVKDRKGKEVIERYDSNSVMDRAELFNQKMPCSCAFAALSFSHALAQSCETAIPDFLERRKNASAMMSESLNRK